MHFERLQEYVEKAKNASFLPQRYFSGFLFEAEEYDLGLKGICRFKALTSSFSWSIKEGEGIGNFWRKTNNWLSVDIEVVKQDKITVILFVLETRNSIKFVPFKNVLFETKGEKPLFSLLPLLNVHRSLCNF